MVFTFLPLTTTGARGVPWACARSSRPQLQKTIPLAAAAVLPLRSFVGYWSYDRSWRVALPGQAGLVSGSIATLLRRTARRHARWRISPARGIEARRDAAVAAAQTVAPAIADEAARRVVEIVEAPRGTCGRCSRRHRRRGRSRHAPDAAGLPRPDGEGVEGRLRSSAVGQVDRNRRSGGTRAPRLSRVPSGGDRNM